MSLTAALFGAAYMSTLFLVVTSPVGIVLGFVILVVRRRGGDRGSLDLPVGVRRATFGLSMLVSALLLLVGGYGATQWRRRVYDIPPLVAPMVVALLVVEVAVLGRFVVSSRRRGLATLWAGLVMWVELVIALVATGGPGLGAL